MLIKMEGVNYKNFDAVVSKMRSFFKDVKGFVEVHPQNKKSILAACEDPKTIATYNYEGQIWPLPQTGQMWLEHYLLEHPEENGFFCVSTSYLNEPDPVPKIPTEVNSPGIAIFNPDNLFSLIFLFETNIRP